MASQINVVSKDSANSPEVRFEWALLHAGFVLIGIITPLLGPLMPILKNRWDITDAQAGSLFASQFTGSFIGTICTGYLLPRMGFSRMLALGFLCFALGFSFFGIGPWTVSVVAVAVYGFGYGLANPAANLRATQLPSKNVAAAVSLLNFSWGVGAVACPFLVGLWIPLVGVRGVAIILMCFSALLGAVHYFNHTRNAGTTAVAAPKRSLADWMEQLRMPAAIPLALIFFLYVGSEVGVGGWVALQEKRLPGAGSSALALAPSFFYGMLLFGRGIAPVLLRRISTPRLALAGLISGVIGTAIISFSPHPYLLYLGAAIVGFGFAPQFPIFVTWLAEIFREKANWLSAFHFTAAGIGGAVLPWVVGQVSTRTGSLSKAFLVPMFACVLMAVLSLRVRPDRVVAATAEEI
jgi:FHS family glucose/mannose:H+ symporter-like MFS transporter